MKAKSSVFLYSLVALLMAVVMFVAYWAYPRLVLTDWGRRPAGLFGYPGHRDYNLEIFASNSLSSIVSGTSSCINTLTSSFMVENWCRNGKRTEYFDGSEVFCGYRPFPEGKAMTLCRSFRKFGKPNLARVKRAAYQAMVAQNPADSRRVDVVMILPDNAQPVLEKQIDGSLVLRPLRYGDGVWKFGICNVEDLTWTISPFFD